MEEMTQPAEVFFKCLEPNDPQLKDDRDFEEVRN